MPDPVDIQPESVEFYSADGVFVKMMGLRHAGVLVPQHSHTYPHLSLLARGSVRVWRDGVLLGDYAAPDAIHIQAGAKHTFLSLEPNTLVYCIHNVSRSGAVAIDELHEFGG